MKKHLYLFFLIFPMLLAAESKFNLSFSVDYLSSVILKPYAEVNVSADFFKTAESCPFDLGCGLKASGNVFHGAEEPYVFIAPYALMQFKKPGLFKCKNTFGVGCSIGIPDDTVSPYIMFDSVLPVYDSENQKFGIDFGFECWGYDPVNKFLFGKYDLSKEASESEYEFTIDPFPFGVMLLDFLKFHIGINWTLPV